MNNKYRIALIFVLLIALVTGGLYVMNTRLNSLGTVTKLSEDESPHVMVLGLTKLGEDGATHQLRVALHPGSNVVPEKIFIDYNGQLQEHELTLAKEDYVCSHAEDKDHNMPGYETESFQLDNWQPTTAKFDVVFSDKSGKRFSAKYELSHSCAMIMDDTQVNPPKSNDELPPE